MPVAQGTDSAWVFAVQVGDRLNSILNKDSIYDQLYLYFNLDDILVYDFIYCLRNCK